MSAFRHFRIQTFTEHCHASRFVRPESGQPRSIAEIEETLLAVGDEDVAAKRAATEELHDGWVAGYVRPNSECRDWFLV